MNIELYEGWSYLDKHWSYFVYIDEKSNWSQWVFFGMGAILKDNKYYIYPFKPFDSWKRIKLLKKYKGTKYSATWYGRRIGEIILKREKARSKNERKTI